VGADVGDENAEFCGTVRPLRIPLAICPDKLMRCCAAGTDGCLDLRRRAFALDGRVSGE